VKFCTQEATVLAIMSIKKQLSVVKIAEKAVCMTINFLHTDKVNELSPLVYGIISLFKNAGFT